MEKILKFFGLLFLIIVAALYRLYVFTHVWKYTAVKLFSLPTIGLWQAFGISILVSTLTVNSDGATDSVENLTKKTLNSFFQFSVLWLFAWLIFG